MSQREIGGKAKDKPDESAGYFHRRIGMEAIISHLKEKPPQQI